MGDRGGDVTIGAIRRRGVRRATDLGFLGSLGGRLTGLLCGLKRKEDP